MTTTYQLSDKGGLTGQAILLVKVEAPDEVTPEAAWAVFVRAAAEAGVQGTIDSFDTLRNAVANVQQGLGATPVAQPPTPTTVTVGPWGQASPPQLPAAAQQAAVPGPAPFCPHGQREFITGITKSGKNAGRTWRAWACPADRDDPTKCDKEWIRD